jgi:nucleotide-binding universal stress UspA family protein
MTFVVPFDGSALAEAALVRAAEFASVFESRVLAVSVIPKQNEQYARERDWLGPDEEYSRGAVTSTLHRQVSDLCARVDFRHEFVGRFAAPGTIARRLREVADDVDASMVFVGSDNAGDLVNSLSSVGSTVAADDNYDVVIVRNRLPSKVDRLRSAAARKHVKSDFYLTG